MTPILQWVPVTLPGVDKGCMRGPGTPVGPSGNFATPGKGGRTDKVGQLGVVRVAGDVVQLAQLDEVQLLQAQAQLHSRHSMRRVSLD